MRTRLRLGAVTVVALGALLLATALASPAFAWDATVEVKTECLDDGRVKVTYTVTAWEADHAADVHATYSLNGGSELSLPSGELDAEGVFEDHFVLDAGTTGNVVVYVTVDWKDSDEFEFPKGKAYLPEKCKGEDSTTTTSESTTTTSESTTTTSPTTTESSVAPTTSIEETTTTAAVGAAATTSTAGGQLPFTGAGTSQPMLLAGIVLVAGGGLFLLLSRDRRTAR
jgi:uncharacterized surface anchored protein